LIVEEEEEEEEEEEKIKPKKLHQAYNI